MLGLCVSCVCLCVLSGALVRVRACLHTCGRVCAFVRAYMSVEMRARVMRVHVRSPTSINSPGDVILFLAHSFVISILGARLRTAGIRTNRVRGIGAVFRTPETRRRKIMTV